MKTEKPLNANGNISKPQFTIDLTDLFEIRCRGKEVILQYTTDKAAWQAYIKQFKKAMDRVREVSCCGGLWVGTVRWGGW